MKLQMISLLLAAGLALCSSERLVRAPYLPSGWRPKGPAFELPTETKKSVATTTEESPEFESEGSSFLREYGPPNSGQDSIVNSIQNSVTVQNSALNSVQDTVSNLVTEFIPDPEIVSEDILQDLTVQALPDVEANFSFRSDEEIEEEIQIEDIKEEGDNETIVKLGAIDAKDQVVYTTDSEVVQQVDDKNEADNGNKNSGKIEVLEGEKIRENEKAKIAVEEEKANFDVVLINEGKTDVFEADKELVKESEEQIAEVYKTEEKSSVAVGVPLGFREYGPPAESGVVAKIEEDTFQGAQYLPPQGVKRSARRVRISPKRKNRH